MKKLTFITLSILMIGSLSQAMQFAYKCSGTAIDPQGHNDQVAISGIVSSHVRGWGFGGITYKSAGAATLDSGEPIVLQDNTMIGTSGVLQLVDQSKQVEIFLQIPKDNLDELSQQKTGDLPSYLAGVQITKLNGISVDPKDVNWTTNKINCEGTVVKKSKDGFAGFWSSLGNGLANALAKFVWPQFNN